jgi:hypothetical protein
VAASLLELRFREDCVRVVTIKRPPLAIDGMTQDNFHLGDVFDVSPNVGILLTAVGWVRSESRQTARRHEDYPPPSKDDRRHNSDRRHRLEFD